MSERENIVQYKDLVPTETVVNPQDIPPKVLAESLNTASQICKDRHFCAIAFNQMSRETLDKIGFKDMNPSIIYFGKDLIIDTNLSGKLLINPELSLEKILGRSTDMEGCGSIVDKENIMPYMFIERCSVIHGGGYLWDLFKDKPEHREFVIFPHSAAVFQHEHNHLLGKTALSNPESIIDFTNDKIREEIIKTNLFCTKQYFLNVLDHFPHWLIFDNKENRYNIISPTGQFIMNDFE